MTLLTAAVRARVDEAIANAGVPGILLAAQRGSGVPEVLAVGTDADGRTLDRETLFPVASVTKLATALVVLRLRDEGRLDLDAPLAATLPAAAAARTAGVTPRGLLCHTAGLPTDVAGALAPYAPGLEWSGLAESVLATGPDEPPGARVRYSNVGYGLLALAAERAAGRRFGELLAELVLAPLAVEGYLGVEPPRAPARARDVRGRHRETEIEPFNSTFWRSLAMPWAGLITTAEGAMGLARAFTGDLLRPETRREATTDQTGGLSGGFGGPLLWNPSPWGLGPELRGQKRPHWAPAGASPASFGHAGASGVLAWHDPAVEVTWTLIGTRTADSGWLLRQGAAIGEALLAAT